MFKFIKSNLSSVIYLGIGILTAYFKRRDPIGSVAVGTKYGKWYIRPGNSDILVLKEVFKKRHFDLSIFKQYDNISSKYKELLAEGVKSIIIDAGANIGAASIWFSKLFPEAIIFAIEPDPDNAELCRRNTASNPNITVVEAAIGSADGNVTISQGAGLSWAVQTEISNDGKIPIVTVDRLISKSGSKGALLIVKVDIEGFESELFASATTWLEKTPCLIVELHDYLFPGRRSSIPLQHALLGKDFEIVILGENLVFFK